MSARTYNRIRSLLGFVAAVFTILGFVARLAHQDATAAAGLLVFGVDAFIVRWGWFDNPRIEIRDGAGWLRGEAKR